ncbi:MAG: DUF2497 domain-containing protein [Sphingomonadales bacterium]|nr:DUF2497 domain-containing protein [Sphingomonadales bacterium]
MSKEPSMEDILSSIRRVIEREDSERDGSVGQTARPAYDDEPLELTERSELPESTPAAPFPAIARDSQRISMRSDDDDAIVSSGAADASRAQLASLESLAGSDPAPSTSPTIEEMVRESLRPMLKAWLDDNLPAVVERIVQREVERITRK